MVQRQRICKGSGYGVQETAHGTVLDIRPGKGGGGGASNFAERFWITGVTDKYLLGVPYAIRAAYTSDQVVSIAKPQALRNYPVGVTGNYRYDGQQGVRYLRIAADVEDGFIELRQVLEPGYAALMSAYAVKPKGGVYGDTESATEDITLLGADGEDIVWLDVNVDANHWAPSYNAFELCINKELYTALFAAGTPEKLVT